MAAVGEHKEGMGQAGCIVQGGDGLFSFAVSGMVHQGVTSDQAGNFQQDGALQENTPLPNQLRSHHLMHPPR